VATIAVRQITEQGITRAPSEVMKQFLRVPKNLSQQRGSPHRIGSNMGPLAAEYQGKWWSKTQNKPKRANKIDNPPLVLDQGVGGSNPLAPTKHFRMWCGNSSSSSSLATAVASGHDCSSSRGQDSKAAGVISLDSRTGFWGEAKFRFFWTNAAGRTITTHGPINLCAERTAE